MLYLAIVREYLVSGSDDTFFDRQYETIEDNELERRIQDIFYEPLDSELIVVKKEDGYDTYSYVPGYDLYTKVTVFSGDHAEEDFLNTQMGDSYYE